jgi:hypothetical protein
MFKKDTDSSLETIRNVILRLARHHRLNQRKYKIHVCGNNINAFKYDIPYDKPI